jgi:tetratricopeptide (TPR) repeat protein
LVCLVAPLLLLAMALHASAASETERRFIWNEASSRLAAAARPEEFLQAAQTYGKLVEAGVRNGPLFYNLGTALLRAGRYDAAYQSLLRAERYMGTTPEIRHNLILAIAAGKHAETVSLPWSRFVLFWHYGLPMRMRLAIAAAAFCCGWVALTVWQLGARRFAGPLLAVSLIVLALFGSSAATTLHQEARAESRSLMMEHGMKVGKT